jgi:hypothetical protein
MKSQGSRHRHHKTFPFFLGILTPYTSRYHQYHRRAIAEMGLGYTIPPNSTAHSQQAEGCAAWALPTACQTDLRMLAGIEVTATYIGGGSRFQSVERQAPNSGGSGLRAIRNPPAVACLCRALLYQVAPYPPRRAGRPTWLLSATYRAVAPCHRPATALGALPAGRAPCRRPAALFWCPAGSRASCRRPAVHFGRAACVWRPAAGHRG